MKIDIDWQTIPQEYHDRVRQAEALFQEQVNLLEEFELESLWHGYQNSPGVIGVGTTAIIENGEPRVSIPLNFDLNEAPLKRTVEQLMRRLYDSLRQELRDARRRMQKRLAEMEPLTETA